MQTDHGRRRGMPTRRCLSARQATGAAVVPSVLTERYRWDHNHSHELPGQRHYRMATKNVLDGHQKSGVYQQKVLIQTKKFTGKKYWPKKFTGKSIDKKVYRQKVLTKKFTGKKVLTKKFSSKKLLTKNVYQQKVLTENVRQQNSSEAERISNDKNVCE